jgi:hypothetical protein
VARALVWRVNANGVYLPAKLFKSIRMPGIFEPLTSTRRVNRAVPGLDDGLCVVVAGIVPLLNLSLKFSAFVPLEGNGCIPNASGVYGLTRCVFSLAGSTSNGLAGLSKKVAW